MKQAVRMDWTYHSVSDFYYVGFTLKWTDT